MAACCSVDKPWTTREVMCFGVQIKTAFADTVVSFPSRK
jgi:hypothetical protein